MAAITDPEIQALDDTATALMAFAALRLIGLAVFEQIGDGRQLTREQAEHFAKDCEDRANGLKTASSALLLAFTPIKREIH